MKKGCIKTFFISLLLAFVFAFSACTPNNRVYVDTYEITQEDTNLIYYVGDEFSVEGYKLTMVMTDGTVQEVMLTDDMIKTGPDMTKSGKQNVVVNYNGQSFSFGVYIDKEEKKDLIEKLKKFLEGYNNLNELPSELLVDVTTHLSASYLNEKIDTGITDHQIKITPENIFILNNYVEEGSEGYGEYIPVVSIPENPLSKYVYEALLNSVIRNSLTPENKDIVDVEQQIVNIGLTNVFMDFFKELAKFDYMEFIIKNVIFTEDLSYYVKYLSNMIANTFSIDIVYDGSEDENEDQINEAAFSLETFLTRIITNIMNWELQNIDVRSEIIELCRIVYNYSLSDTVKGIVKMAAKEVVGYDCETQEIVNDNVDYAHLLSNFVPYFKDLVVINKYDEEAQQWVTLDPNSSAEVEAYVEDYVSNFQSVILSIEDYIYGTFKAAVDGVPFNTREKLLDIQEASQNFINLINSANDEKQWYVPYDEDIVQTLGIIVYTINLYDEDVRVFIANIVKEYGVIELILFLIEDTRNLPDNIVSFISNIVYDLLRPAPYFNYSYYIRNICNIMGIQDESYIEKYILKYEGWCSDINERCISWDDENLVYTTYDDCNPFGFSDFGEISDLCKHDTTKPVSDATIEAFNSLSELFAIFMNDFEIPTDGSEYITTIGDDAIYNYNQFYKKAVDIYEKNSLVSFTKDIKNDITKSAVIGVNYPYTITFGTDINPEEINFQSVVANLFGYSSKDEFINYAKNLANVYSDHRDNIINSRETNEALDNGCFYTSDGSFVFPIAVKNQFSDIILMYVILDTDGLVSVWVNDVSSVLKAINFNGKYYTDSIIKNHILCKNTLFVRGLAKEFSLLSDTFNAYLENIKSLEGNDKLDAINEIAKEFNITTEEARPILEKRIEAYEKLVKIIKYIESIPNNGFDPIVLTTYISEILPLMADGYILNKDIAILYDVLLQFLDLENTIKNNIKKVIIGNKVEISNYLVSLINSFVGFDDTESAPYKELEIIIRYAINEYCNDSIDFAGVMNAFFKTVNTYSEGPNKILANSVGMLMMVYIGQNSAVKVDYNKLFEYIELPNGVNKINYNKLVEELWSNSTYSELFKVTNPTIRFVENESGDIIGEIVTFKVSVDFDITLSSINASAEFSFYIPLS